MASEWTVANLRKILVFRRPLSGRALFWNWHNVIGFWCAGPLFFIVVTGVIMSYPWANNLLYRLTGSDLPSTAGIVSAERPNIAQSAANQSIQASGVTQSDGSRPKGQRATDQAIKFGFLFSRAEQQVPDWKSITLKIANIKASGYYFPD